ncbi:MAG: hypothetical protein U9O94_11155, partial [Nanoarchaeota archaeon]|nr:hypothetical protein [Nanoarchaeota archaeon]
MGKNLDSKKELLRKLKERKKIEDDKELINFKPSPIQEAFLISKAKIRVVEGGNRSGKTEVCSVDTAIQITGVIPKVIKESYPMEFIRPGRYWASSLSYPFSRDVARPKLRKYLPTRVVDRFNKADSIFYLKDGGEIGLKSQDSGRDAYAGDSRLQVWMDEEHSREVYKEAYMRTIDCSGRMVMSFTPVDGLTWAYEDLFLKAKRYFYTVNKHGIKEEAGIVHTPEEIDLLKDREVRVRENTDPNADPNVEIFQMAIYDNIHLPSVKIHNAEKENKDDIAGYQARILGLFSKITGRSVYSVGIILKGREQCPSTFDRGEIIDGKFVPQIDGRLVIFKKKKDLGVGHYVVGGDISEGLENGDSSCAQILDHKTCEQVGIWHGKVPPEEMARIFISIGRYYNNAWLAPERNFHGFGVVSQIREQRYPRLFCDSNPDLHVDPASERMKFGWDTNARSKPIMVQDLGRFLSEGHIKINDPNTWEELLTFIYDNKGKTGALRGCHD